MSIIATHLTVECDHPGCTQTITFQYGMGTPNKTISDGVRAGGWQPYKEFEFCPEHRRES
jgi:hypothetical protein